MAKKKKENEDYFDLEFDLRATTNREKEFLQRFEEKFLEEHEDITQRELIRAKKVAVLRHRESADSLESMANESAAKLLEEDEEEEEE